MQNTPPPPPHPSPVNFPLPHAAGNEDAEEECCCPVCLETISADEDNAYIYVHTSCNKRFHVRCMDTWLREQASRGRCPHCQRPVRTAARSIPDRFSNVRRRLQFEAPAPRQWIYRTFSTHWIQLVPAIANVRRLEEEHIPYQRLPITEALRAHFPNIEFNYENSETLPVIVDLDHFRRRNTPLMILFDPDYTAMAKEEERRMNVYSDIFAREYFHNRPVPGFDSIPPPATTASSTTAAEVFPPYDETYVQSPPPPRTPTSPSPPPPIILPQQQVTRSSPPPRRTVRPVTSSLIVTLEQAEEEDTL